MLLYRVSGPHSFQHIRTVHGHAHHTSKAACEALGLLENDLEYDECLTKAAVFNNASAFRTLFMTVILDAQPTDPLSLMQQHRDDLMEECHHQLVQNSHMDRPAAEHLWDLALTDLNALAKRQGQSLAELGLPMPSQEFMPEGWLPC